MLPRPDKMDELETCLQRELTDTKPRMIGIKGEWGVGKTFRWNQIWKELKSSDHSLRKKKYSYVSLFGIESIDRLRREILGRIQLSGGTKRPGKNSPLRRADQFLRSSKFKGTGAPLVLADWIEDWLVSGCVICIDDIERMDPAISVVSVFGYLNFLKEERGCTVVLIFNEERLDPCKQSELAKYREKILDLEFLYDPGVSENLRIVWKEGVPDQVTKIFTEAGINNLRLMFKIRDAIEEFQSKIEGGYPSLWPVFEQNCIKILLVLYLLPDGDTKSHVLTADARSKWIDELDAEESIKATLRRISFIPLKSNQLVVDFFSQGYFQPDHYCDALSLENKAQDIDQIGQKHEAIWRMYHGNFLADQQAFSDALEGFIDEYCELLHPSAVSESIKLLQELGSQSDFSPVIKRVARTFVEGGGTDYGLSGFPGLLPEMKSEVKNQLEEKSRKASLEELFDRLSQGNGYEPSDLDLLNQFSSAEIKKWLLGSDRKGLLQELRVILQRCQLSAETCPGLKEKLTLILKDIAARSEIDRSRVEKVVGVRLD